MERAKFLAIFASNLDEFFMVRVAGLREQTFGGIAPQDVAAEGLDPIAQLHRISLRVRQLVAEQYDCWSRSIAPGLEREGIHFLKPKDLDENQVYNLDQYLMRGGRVVLCAGNFEADFSPGGLSVQSIETGLDDWLARIPQRGAHLGYQEQRDGVTVGLLRAPGLTDWTAFTCLNSLRDVEPTVNLLLEDHGMDRDEERDWYSHTPTMVSAESEAV